MQYGFREIEKKWTAFWQEHKTFKVQEDPEKPKYYVLDMFPYPSGAGLHVGHPLGYIASDIMARYRRHLGFNVLHPMGFDAFGLPAEQYAIQTGQHPAETTKKNIARYKEQLQNLGFSYDWDRMVITSDPSYYRWTQWIFLQLFEAYFDPKKNKARPIQELLTHLEQHGTKGWPAWGKPAKGCTAQEWRSMSAAGREEILGSARLAYQSWSMVNWCPELGTVLANDEVRDGKSERGGFPVEKIRMKQWFLRITPYADRLLQGLENLDWPESVKEMQRNWIGKSTGAWVHFATEERDRMLKVFTTRPDTIYGCTFMVLAPEHPWCTEASWSKDPEVKKYLEYVKSRSDIERQQQKNISGVFTGTFALHPLTGKRLPIWIAEYVLGGYGTGAIMAVPAEDERDLVFAQKFALPVQEVIQREVQGQPGDKSGVLVNSGFLDGLSVPKAIVGAIEELSKRGIGGAQTQYRLRDAGFSRQRYWGEPFPIIYREGVPVALQESDLPVELPKVRSYHPTGDGKSPLAHEKDWVQTRDGERETDTMPGYAGSSWYFLRYMDPNNQERFVGQVAEQYWQQVDLYIGGAEHAVGHLLYARFWQKFLYDLGLVGQDEPFKKLINQGMIQGRSQFVYRLEDGITYVSLHQKGNYKCTPIHVDVSMVRNDILDREAFIDSQPDRADARFILEPAGTEWEGEYVCGAEVEKMSKSRYNVVNPDQIISQYSADTLRLYEMFLGPVEQHKPWNTQGIEGVFKFLKKTWRLYHDAEGNFRVEDRPASKEALKSLHYCIKHVRDDLERFSLNTVVSHLMVCVNQLTDQEVSNKEILEPLALLLSPLAPHLAEELWERLGHAPGTVSSTPFPVHEDKYLIESTFTYPVSINGKVRAHVKLDRDIQTGLAQEQVLQVEEVSKWVPAGGIKRFIHVPGKIINIVV